MARLLHSAYIRLANRHRRRGTKRLRLRSRLETGHKATDIEVLASMADLNLRGPADGSVAPQSKEVNPRTPDRRCSRRIAIVLPIEVQGESPFNTRTVRGAIQNLSANGMSFVCGERYLPGQILYVTMNFGDQVHGIDGSLTLQFRVQRLEQSQRNDPKQFAVAVALDI